MERESTIYSSSYALEDVFFLYINAFGGGYFVDVGCGHPTIGNNSHLLETMGWRGIAMDVEKHSQWEVHRTTKCIAADATTAVLKESLRRLGAPRVIDALSIDVDDASLDALLAVPLDDYAFRSVVIEHDAYRTPGLRRGQRAYLASHGYTLACANVMHEPNKPFEDWWLRRDLVDASLLDRLCCEDALDVDVIRRFGNKNRIVRLHGFNGAYPQVEYA